jgi:hypothetical protein
MQSFPKGAGGSCWQADAGCKAAGSRQAAGAGSGGSAVMSSVFGTEAKSRTAGSSAVEQSALSELEMLTSKTHNN